MSHVFTTDDVTTAAVRTERSEQNCWRLICVSASEPRWTNLAVQLAEAEIPHPRIEWVDSAALLMSRLREASCAAILVEHAVPVSPRHASLNTLPLIQALRGGGYHGAIVVLMSAPDDLLLAELPQLDCEPLASPAPWESPALLPVLQRAVRLTELRRAYEKLAVQHERRRQRDHDEAEQMLRHQQELLSTLIQPPGIVAPSNAALRDGYQELLRTSMLGDSGCIGAEIRQLAAALVRADFSPQQAMSLHLDCVRTLVEGLGQPSSRHVLHRADLLALDLMLQLAEGYRQRAA